MNQISAEVRHFFHRAGFGVGMPELSNSIKKSIAQLADDEIQAALLPLETDSYGSGLPVRDQSPFATRDQIQMSDTTSSQVDRLRAKWVESMIDTRTVLAEKMTLFWHGHFACQCNTENVAKEVRSRMP